MTLSQPEQDRINLLDRHDTLLEKRAYFEQELQISASPDQRFELRKRLEQIEADLKLISERIVDLDKQQIGDRIYRALQLLNYDAHLRAFAPLAAQAHAAAFLVYGPPDFGQRWLVNRLLSEYRSRPRTFQFSLNKQIGGNDAGYIWRKLLAEFHLPRTSTPQQIAERVCDCRKTQDVLFFFDCMLDLMHEGALTDFVREFWQPLVTATEAALPSPYRLFVFLIDRSGCQRAILAGTTQECALQSGQALDLQRVLCLPILPRFTVADLSKWVGAGPTITILPTLPDRLDIPQVLRASNEGVPELAFDEICAVYDFFWLNGVDQWLTLYRSDG